jgi:ABC-type transporter Mla subunit MlaD
MNEMTLLTIFIGVTAVAVVLQMLILAGIGIAVMRIGKSVQTMQAKVNEQVLPMAEKIRVLVDETTPKVRTLVDESIPKLQKAVTNLTESTAVVRAQADKIDGTVSHLLEVVRVQVNRVDSLATRTFERVDNAAATVQHTVTSPFRRVSAVVEGVVAGIGSFAGKRREAQVGKASPGEQMFI